MQEVVISPHAASLSQSFRDLGYSLETAIADIIDNSITAKASKISIIYQDGNAEEAYLALLDNGSGMDRETLMEAMRPGSRNPRGRRSADDLGRFGLGLKTASFSQCRSLTVISKCAGQLAAIEWDLDLIHERNEWLAKIYSAEEINSLPPETIPEGNGTCVLWKKLDRLESGDSDRSREDVYEKLSVLEKHLSLVFHRYLDGSLYGRKVSMNINGHPVEAFDPFCRSHTATNALNREIIRIDGHEITIEPYILPHHSKLTETEHDFYKSRSDFVSNQGVYIYRNARLMAWGDWFRLIPKSENTKLARVKIDFPNALDEYWTIDIKKSRAQPPAEVRDTIRQVISRIADQSKKVYAGRGAKLFDDSEYRLWHRRADRGHVNYIINREHPLLMAVRTKLDEPAQRAFIEVLALLEKSLPVAAIYSEYASSPRSFDMEGDEAAEEELREKLLALYQAFSGAGLPDKEAFTRMVIIHTPFNKNEDLTRKLIGEIA